MTKYFSYNYVSRAFAQIRCYGWPLISARYWLRSRILQAAPVDCPPDAEREVHTQVCQRDWLNALWSLRSFRHFGGEPFRLVVHPHGLSEQARSTIVRHFPGVVLSDETDVRQQIIGQWGTRYPTLVRFRQDAAFFTLPKVIDSHFLAKNEYYITLDPDVLFFSEPLEMMAIVANPSGKAACFNVLREKAVGSKGCYIVDEGALEHEYNIKLDPHFGIGCGWVRPGACDWDLVEAVLAEIPLIPGFDFMMDQTVSALMVAKPGYVTLDRSRYTIEPVKSLDGVVTRHYYSKTRDLMYLEGMRTLARRGLLEKWMNGLYNES